MCLVRLFVLGTRTQSNLLFQWFFFSWQLLVTNKGRDGGEDIVFLKLYLMHVLQIKEYAQLSHAGASTTSATLTLILLF